MCWTDGSGLVSFPGERCGPEPYLPLTVTTLPGRTACPTDCTPSWGLCSPSACGSLGEKRREGDLCEENMFICLVITEHHPVVFSPPRRIHASSVLSHISSTSVCKGSPLGDLPGGHTCHRTEKGGTGASISSLHCRSTLWSSLSPQRRDKSLRSSEHP